jgi:hypothetical protein
VVNRFWRLVLPRLATAEALDTIDLESAKPRTAKGKKL